MPPDVASLPPSVARSLCRFCLEPQLVGTMLLPPTSNSVDALRWPRIRSWPDSEMGLLYAQLSGGEQLHLVDDVIDETDGTAIPPLSDGWCTECPKLMQQAVDALRKFREANMFWQRYALVWSKSKSSASPPMPFIKMEIEFKEEDVAGDEHSDDNARYDDRNDDDECEDDYESDHKPIQHRRQTPPPKTPKRVRRSKTKPPARPKSTPSARAAAANEPHTTPTAAAAKKRDGEICHICGGLYTCRMKRHMDTAHGKLICDLCGRTFSHKVPLRRHFRDDHGFQRYTCDVCQLPNLTLSIWQRHQDRHGPRVPRFACDQCGNTYAAQSSLRQHIALAHDHREVTCPDCGKVFQNEARLRGHAIRHRPKGLTCPEPGCPRMFWLTKEMKEHVRTVHRKIRKYECAGCAKAFLVNAQLKKHLARGRCPGGGAAVVVAVADAKMTTSTLASSSSLGAPNATSGVGSVDVGSSLESEQRSAVISPHITVAGQPIMSSSSTATTMCDTGVGDGGPMEMQPMHPQFQQQPEIQPHQQHMQYNHQSNIQNHHQSPLSSLWSAMLHRR